MPRPAAPTKDEPLAGGTASGREPGRSAPSLEQKTAASEADPPLRVSVLNGMHGITVAVRANGASRHDTLALSQRALAELRRQGVTDARVVVNGVITHSPKPPGEPHGD